ncbi:MAG: universal stress protein [Desulfobacteraceae bacterium]|nr:universal stress protein [Desulfobacteraceae bacterium]MCB9494601.1 universal stress protein [Desulfobacteraceae bacterium]
MKNKILVPVNNYETSKAVLNYLIGLSLCPDKAEVTLLHILRIPSGGEELMGKRYMQKEPEKVKSLMVEAREELVIAGFNDSSIHTEVTQGQFATVADGIIDYFKKNHHTMVVIGRKKLSKAEEFVLGDVSIKLVRALENTAVIVVKTI